VDSLNQNFWSQPWSFKQGFLFAVTFPLLGFIMELSFTHATPDLPSFPLNLIILGSFLLLISLLFFLFRKKAVIQFLSSISAAIPAIAIFVGIVLLMGLLPQNNEAPFWVKKLELNHLLDHAMFYFSFAYLIVVLMFTVLKRLIPFKIKNSGFLLNHLGLLTILLAGVFGSGDMYRINMICYYNQPIWYGTDEFERIYELPLALELCDFSIEYYNPEVVVVDNSTGKAIGFKPKPDPFLLENKTIEIAQDIQIKVDTLFLYALKMNNAYYPIHNMGSSQAARVSVFNTTTGTFMQQGWIASESFMQPAQFLSLENYSIFLSPPKPKKYTSVLKLYTPNMQPKHITLEVNKPYYYKGWKLYQVSYDSAKGEWSEYSVIEAVRDPWLPVVYTGIGMLILGALSMIFQIRKKGTHE
jgi:hypothetical protein